MLEVGQQVGDYIIEQELGGGGMATVYRARHAVLETAHAVKVLRPAYRVDPEARRRFVDEARIQAGKLDHRNIVRVTNIIATAEVAALVMELVDPAAGGTLDDWIAARKSPPTADEFRVLALPIIAAIGYAHRKGIIHRDLKPANVLLSLDDAGEVVPKLTDFGIAKVADAPQGVGKKSTHADARMGTVGYSSPEQVRKAKEVTQRSDVFSLGALLYELATLKPAFEGASDYDVMENIVHGRFKPPRERVPELEPAIAAAIEKALASDPEGRFASCEELAAALGGSSDPAVHKAAPAVVAAPAVGVAPVVAAPAIVVAPVVVAAPVVVTAPAVATTRAAVSEPALASGRGGLIALVVAVFIVGGAGVWFAFERTKPQPAASAVVAELRPLDAATIVAEAPPVDAAVPDAPIDAPPITFSGEWKRSSRIRFNKRVYYSRNSFAFSKSAIKVLDELVAVMQANPELGVQIKYHLTWFDEDRQIAGTNADSKLGAGRLTAPAEYLEAHGISPDRIWQYGGESHGSGSDPATDPGFRSTEFWLLIDKNQPALK